MRKGHAAIPCTDTHRNEQTRTKAGTQCRKSSDEQRFSIPRSHLHQWLAHLKKKERKTRSTPKHQAKHEENGHAHIRTTDAKLAYLLLSLRLRRLAQERLVLLLASVVPLVLSLEKPTQSTYVRLRNHVESRSGNRDTPEKQQRRVLRGPAEALVHRVVLR